MAMPSVVKTWQHSVNQTLGPYGTFTLQQQSLMFALKQTLTTFSSAPWSVLRSSNSVASGIGDTWATTADLVWSNQGDTGTARSWIVLGQTGMGSNFQWLISCQSNGQSPGPEHSVFMAISPNAGFTGGTTTTRPTATDEQIIIVGASGTNNGVWVSPTNAAQANRFVLHVSHASDGSATRVHFWYNSRHMTFLTFGKVVDSPAVNPLSYWGFCFPNVAGGQDDNSKATYAKWNDIARLNFFYNGTVFNGAGYCTSEGFITSMVGEQILVANEIDGTWPISTMGVQGVPIALRGRIGRIVDCWWTSTALADGDSFPGGGTNLYAKLGHMVFPWNGTTPLVA